MRTFTFICFLVLVGALLGCLLCANAAATNRPSAT